MTELSNSHLIMDIYEVKGGRVEGMRPVGESVSGMAGVVMENKSE